MQELKIKSIKHSGRKGLRGTPVADQKYEDMIGCTVFCDIKNAVQFHELRWNFDYHPRYDYWITSEVLALSYDEKNHIYELETANTIYELEEIIKDGV